MADNTSNTSSPVGTLEGIRYPGVGRMFLIWSAVGALTVLRYQLPFVPPGRSRETLSYLLACVSWYFPWAVLTPLVFRLERRFPLGGKNWVRHILLLAGISVPFSLAASPLMMALFVAVRFLFGDPLRLSHGLASWFSLLPTGEGIFWFSIGGGYFLRTLYELHSHEQRAARLALEKTQLEASLNQAQLEVLRARLNPHFLFNSLQNISVLTKQDPQTASRMLVVLGDLLRAVLRLDSQPESTLAEEVELARAYVALEQMRFADRLRVTFDIADEVRSAMVPCFLMQPLLENAIIHGLRGVRKTGVISVQASGEAARLIITVTDNGNGPPGEMNGMKMGVGLGSTCERLSRMYPEEHEFSIRRLSEGGAEVRMAIPLRFVVSSATVLLHEQIPTADR